MCIDVGNYVGSVCNTDYTLILGRAHIHTQVQKKCRFEYNNCFFNRYNINQFNNYNKKYPMRYYCLFVEK